MTAARARAGARDSGYTLLEMAISVTIFAIVGFGLVRAVDMGKGSQRAVAERVEANAQMRSVRSLIAEDLSLSDDDNISVEVLPDGNDQLSVMQPIVSGGDLTWGVFDMSLGDTDEDRNREDWKIRYTVDSVVAAWGTNRRLLRQIVDDLDVVQQSEVVLEGLRHGAGDPRGFSIAKSGDMWDVQITMSGESHGAHTQGVSFHVRTRN